MTTQHDGQFAKSWTNVWNPYDLQSTGTLCTPIITDRTKKSRTHVSYQNNLQSTGHYLHQPRRELHQYTHTLVLPRKPTTCRWVFCIECKLLHVFSKKYSTLHLSIPHPHTYLGLPHLVMSQCNTYNGSKLSFKAHIRKNWPSDGFIGRQFRSPWNPWNLCTSPAPQRHLRTVFDGVALVGTEPCETFISYDDKFFM